MLFLAIASISFSIFMIILFTYAYGGLRAAPWVPMRRRDLIRLNRLIPLTSQDVVYDLGCGDARMLIHALEEGAGRAVGYEISLMPYLIARIKGRKFKHTLHIRYRDFWRENVSGATVIFVFLSYKAHAKLGEKFIEELKPGTRIVAYVWPIEGWIPKIVNKTPGDLSMYIYER